MTDPNPFAFLKSLWKPLEQPLQGLLPPLTEDQINTKINELRAVEQWLTIQASMLQMTISALEMQKSGVQALKRAEATIKGTVDKARDASQGN